MRSQAHAPSARSRPQPRAPACAHRVGIPERRRARTLAPTRAREQARSMLIALLVFVWLLIWVITLFEVIRRPDLTTTAKVVWAAVILVIPVIGVIVYL